MEKLKSQIRIQFSDFSPIYQVTTYRAGAYEDVAQYVHRGGGSLG